MSDVESALRIIIIIILQRFPYSDPASAFCVLLLYLLYIFGFHAFFYKQFLAAYISDSHQVVRNWLS